MNATATFTLRPARSAGLVVGLGMAIVVEAVALHLWLVGGHPILAWVLTANSVAALAWLVGDSVAMGSSTVVVSRDVITLRISWRACVRVDRSSIKDVVRLVWRDFPQPGTPGAEGYLNLTKPAEPNVLLSIDPPAAVRLVGGIELCGTWSGRAPDIAALVSRR